MVEIDFNLANSEGGRQHLQPPRRRHLPALGRERLRQAGRLQLPCARHVADSDERQKMLLFIPGRLTDGIEFSDDPLLPARDGFYRVSFERRSAAP